jgi:hypothetical protein
MTIAQILGAPSTYSGKHVTVSGTVAHLDRETAPDGSVFLTFALCASSCIPVFGTGTASLRNGATSSVHGTFYALKHFGGVAFHNAIEADSGSL